MKSLNVSLSVALLAFQAHVAFSQTAAAPRYVVTENGPHHRVWARVTLATNDAGIIAANTNAAYTEVATGLNYLKNGQWTEASEQIDILDSGGAAATNGQHQAFFPPDISQGQIGLTLPDGKQLQSRVSGLAYFDGTNSVLIAQLTNSIGVVVGNQVIYTNCLVGDVNASVRYTYTKSSFEQDIIIVDRPLPPEQYGLNSANCRLLALTEFFDPVEPTVSTVSVAPAGISAEEDELDWGSMRMGQGKAFSVGSESDAAYTTHTWDLLDGRRVLVEQVPLKVLAHSLENLEQHQASLTTRKFSHLASNKLQLPPRHPAPAAPRRRLTRLAKTPIHSGLVIDYVTINGTMNPSYFAGDSTYFVSANVILSGPATFEDGCVIKFATNTSISISSSTQVTWLGTPYRPVVLTSKDDTSIGSPISGATGNVTNYYANPALSIGGNFSLSITNFRIVGAQQAITVNGSAVKFYNGQIVNCSNGVSAANLATASLRNMLFANVATNLNNVSISTVEAENVTFGGSTNYPIRPAILASSDSAHDPYLVNFTNCVIANITTYQGGAGGTLAGSFNGFYNNSQGTLGSSTFTASASPFQQVGAGFYYLTNTSGFQGKGTTNVDPTMLASFARKTTAGPTLYTNKVFSSGSVLSPGIRGSTSAPDLGFQYDALDYLCSQVSGTRLLLTNGVAFGMFGAYGIAPGATGFISQGCANALNRVCFYPSVQEQPIRYNNVSTASSEVFSSINGVVFTVRFTDFPMQGARQNFFDGNCTVGSMPVVTVKDCQLRGVNFAIQNAFANVYPGPQVTFLNNLFNRCNINLYNGYLVYSTQNGNITYQNPLGLTTYNNLFWSNAITLTYKDAQAQYPTAWTLKDCVYDGTSISYTTDGNYANYVSSGNNAFNNVSNPLGGSGNVTLTSLSYATGPLGNRYINSSTPTLVDAGSRTAPNAGLYQYTMLTFQVKETNSQVDIGFHYVACNASGLPDDSNGDNVPDYLADANGDGIENAGEVPWAAPPTVVGPVSQSVFDQDIVTFAVTAGGTPPFSYAWQFNGTPMGTGPILTITNVISGDGHAGTYTVQITGPGGAIQASATLTELGHLGPEPACLEMDILGPRQNYVFRSDTTYYIWNVAELDGTTTLEGNTIIKLSDSSGLRIVGNLNCATAPYEPAIFTWNNDGSLGYFSDDPSEWGRPFEERLGIPYLDLSSASNTVLSNCRFSYADFAVTAPAVPQTLDLWDCQFLSNNCAITNANSDPLHAATNRLHNVLVSGAREVAGCGGGAVEIDGEQVTALVENFWSPSHTPTRVNLTNCIIFTAGTAPTPGPNVVINPSSFAFAAVDDGNFYLPPSSVYQSLGTPSISTRMASELATKSTSPPVSYPSYFAPKSNLTLAPQATRYNGVNPALGYYYDAIDYTVNNMQIAGITLTVAPGTVIGLRHEFNPGFDLENNSQVVSHGTPTQPIVFVNNMLVQEGPFAPSPFTLYGAVVWGDYNPSDNYVGLQFDDGPTVDYGSDMFFALNASFSPQVSVGMDFQFARFYMAQADIAVWAGIRMPEESGYSPYSIAWTMKDCCLHNGEILLGAEYPSPVQLSGSVVWSNNLFDRILTAIAPCPYPGQEETGDMPFQANNNLFRGGWLCLEPLQSNPNDWTLHDNLFDNVAIEEYATPTQVSEYNNAYVEAPSAVLFPGQINRLSPSGANDVVLSSYPVYAAGPFGNFYQVAADGLTQKGSQSAAAAGLYAYTVLTNGTEEQGAPVSIGLHYPAANASGNPIDSNGNGLPDWWQMDYFGALGQNPNAQDASGDGYTLLEKFQLELFPNVSYPDPYVLIQPWPQSVLSGATVTFSVSAGGTQPLQYQWQKGAIPIQGQTSATLVLNSAQPSDSSLYSVVVTSGDSSHTTAQSEDAALVVYSDPTIKVSPSSAVRPGGSAVLTASIIYDQSVTYQWYLNGSPIAGATQASYTISNIQQANQGTYSVVLNGNSSLSSSAYLGLCVPPPLPVAMPDTFSVAQGSSQNYLSVLNNAYVQIGDPEVSNPSGASHGTTTTDSQSVIYSCTNPNYYGQDSFNYTVSDGIGDSATAQVTVFINKTGNNNPTASDYLVTLPFNTFNASISAASIASDPDGDTLTFFAADQPAKGSLSPVGTGSLSYTRTSTRYGPDTFSITITDGKGGFAQAAITVDQVNSSGDGIPDQWKSDYQLSGTGDISQEDPDNDGVPNLFEYSLGTNPNLSDNPLTLPPLSASGTLNGSVRLSLGIPAEVSSNISFQFFCDNEEVNASVDREGGLWYLNWDTSTLANGGHQVFLVANVINSTDDNVSAIGPVINVNVNNAVLFANDLAGWFTDSLIINASVSTADQYYQIEIYDAATGEHLATLPTGGEAGTVNAGVISESWDFQSDGISLDGPVICDFYLAPTAAALTEQTPPSAEKRFKKKAHIAGSDFTVAFGYNAQSWYEGSAAQETSSMYWNMVNDVIHWLAQPGGNGYNLLPVNQYGAPYNNFDGTAFQWADKTTRNILVNALKTPTCGNFYWWGHGAQDLLTPVPGAEGVGLSAADVSGILKNDQNFGIALHPYRLVILDSCESYSQRWAAAFGMNFTPKESPGCEITDYDTQGLDPQAFVGWYVEKDIPGGSQDDCEIGLDAQGDGQSTLFYYWMEGANISDCVSAYVETLNTGPCGKYGSPAYFGLDRHGPPLGDNADTGQDGYPDDLEYWISGCWDLTSQMR